MADQYSGRWVAVVNIGFICEGYSELFILESLNFNEILKELKLNCVGVINVKGNGNLLPRNIVTHRDNLFELGAEKIFVLTDLDQNACITKTKERITEYENQTIIIAVKQIEAWFLADLVTMKQIFRGNFNFDFPENEEVPFDSIRNLYFNKFQQGIVGRDEKKKLAKRMLNNGFSI